jgi:hypothetical protein
VNARYLLPAGTCCELLAPHMPGVRDYHVLAVDGATHHEDMDQLAGLAARIARELGRELRGDDEAFTIIFNGARTSRRRWAHVHIIPAATPAQKRRAFALLCLKGPLRRVERALRPSLYRASAHSRAVASASRRHASTESQSTRSGVSVGRW